jgi:small conductance mechanosensitive channel
MGRADQGDVLAETGSLTDAVRDTLDGQTVAMAKLTDLVGGLAVNLTISVLILAAAFWTSGWAGRFVRQAIQRFPHIREDQTLAEFASSLTRYAVIIIGIIAVLRRLGVETTSIITVLGAASLAIGLALQGALTNVAAGVMILLFRPYRVGDQVLIAGKSGTVRHFDLFNTEIRDFDNLKVVIPNGKAFGDVVVNYTDITRRRIEIKVGIGYDDDIGKALAIAIRCAVQEPRVLKEPAPWAKVTALAPSTVEVTLRCWTAPAGFWDVSYDLLRKVKESFDAGGVSLPFPTQVSIDESPPRARHRAGGQPPP